MLRLETLLKTVTATLVFLEILKLFELGFVCIVRQKSGIYLYLSGLFFCILFFANKIKNTSLIAIAIINFYLIFKLNVVSQHFAFLTSLLVIVSLARLIKFAVKDWAKVNKIVAYLLIIQMSILYLFAAIWKINFDYFTGTQMLEHIRPFLIIPSQNQPLANLYITLSILGLASELLLAFQFLYNTKFLVYVQSLGFFFHCLLLILIGEDLRIMYQIVIFATSALVIYPLLNKIYWGNEKYLVFWDESCSFCARTISIAKKLDKLNIFEFRNNQELLRNTELIFNKDLINSTIVVLKSDSSEYFIRSQAIFLIFFENIYLWPLKFLIFLKPFVRISDYFYTKIAFRRSCKI